jgi:decaprenylphospho-beta-D-erythro-pentofuranosid-2-ulose 2-reductase
MSRKIVIIGATSTIAEQCARIWAAQAHTDLYLVGRSEKALNEIVADLKVRGPQNQISSQTADFLDPISIEHTVQSLCETQVPDLVLIAHGTLTDQNKAQDDLPYIKSEIEVNGISPLLFAEAFANRFDQVNKGKLAIIGSVAGDRGRQSNYVYGAAKGMVTRYTQGLQHRFHGRPISVTLIKPGQTDTKMTASLKESGAKLADVKQVAQEITDAIEKGKPVVYTPKKWWLIMMIIRHLPSFVFGKMRI